MKKVLVLTLVLAAIGLTAWCQNVFANPVDQPNFDEKINNQQLRLDDAIARRQFTQSEARAVQDNLNVIRETFVRMKRNGALTAPEIARLDRMLEENTRMINKETADFRPEGQPNFDEKINNQQLRLDDAIARRQFTQSEARTVQDNLSWIRETFARMKRDGALTAPEIARLDRMLEENTRMINKETADFRPVYHAGFQERIDNQQERINQGIAKRQLTRREADVVQDNLNWIKETFARMRRDGRLTWKEAAKLDEMLDRNSRLINREKTDVDYNTPFRVKFKLVFSF
jgi:predicted nucleic acid-binding protein